MEMQIQTQQQNNNIMSQTIDCTPTWTASVPLLLHIIQNGTSAKGLKMAEEELLRMAQAADAYVASQKNNNKTLR